MPGWKALEAGGLPRKGAEGAAFGGPRGGFFGGGPQSPRPSSLAWGAPFQENEGRDLEKCWEI